MGEAKEWKEEVIAARFELESYVVLRNISYYSVEADIIAFKRHEGDLIIWDVEVGASRDNFEDIATSISNKFSKERKQIIFDAICKRIGPFEKIVYHCLYVDASWKKNPNHIDNLQRALETKLKSKLETLFKTNKVEVAVMSFGKLITQEIPKIIIKWKKERVNEYGYKTDANEIELPESFRCLRLLDCYIWYHNQR